MNDELGVRYRLKRYSVSRYDTDSGETDTWEFFSESARMAWLQVEANDRGARHFDGSHDRWFHLTADLKLDVWMESEDWNGARGNRPDWSTWEDWIEFDLGLIEPVPKEGVA